MLRPPRFLLQQFLSPVRTPDRFRAEAAEAPEPSAARASSAHAGSGGLAIGACLTLDAEQSHHLRNVLRLKPGDEVEVFDPPSGVSYFGAVVETAGADAAVEIRRIGEARRTGPRIHLIVALVNADRCDLIVEKCTELGVASMSFFAAERSQYSLPADKAEARLGRWRRLAEAALKQSRGARLPEICSRKSLEAALGPDGKAPPPDELRLVLLPPGGLPPALSRQHPAITEVLAVPHPPSSSPPVRLQNLQEMVDSYIIVGPEGGLTDSEVTLAIGRGFLPCTIGTNILRTETAALVGCGILQAFLTSSR